MIFDQIQKNSNQLLDGKIAAGCTPIVNQTIVHTAPHHDDIVLSYHAYVMKNLKQNRNHVVYATSGSNGVSNAFIARVVQAIDDVIIYKSQQFSYQQILEQFVQAYYGKNDEQMFICKLLMVAQFIAEIFGCVDEHAIANSVQSLKLYFASRKPGQKDTPEIIQLKERIRESESDRKWMVCKGDLKNVTHFRSTFYHADEKTIEAAMESDIARLVDYLKNIQPDIITVALDPCGIGPKNHFATLQLVAAAVACLNNKNIKIIGYRNVWSSFEIDEASMIVPVSQQEIDEMKSIFANCFATQKNSIFVGTDIDGNFAEQTEQIHKIQLQQVKNMLGDDFDAMQSDEINNAAGAIFLKVLTVDELLAMAACDN